MPFIRAISILLLGLVLAGVAGPAMALDVQGVRVGQHPDKTRLVIDLTDKADFRVSTLSGPPRLLVELPAFTWRAGSAAAPAGSGIGRIAPESGAPGRGSIVIGLDRPMTVRSAFFLPRGGGNGDRIVIDMVRGAAPAADGGGQVLGQLPAPAQAAQAAYIPPMAAPPAVTQTTIITTPPATAMPARKPATDGKLPMIVIDAGHGGADPGAPGANGVSEKVVTLAMARELKRQLEATGRYRVKLTRDRDEYLRLGQRVAAARAAQGDLFISLHADSIGQAHVRGASIYTLSDKASDEQTARLAARENRADLIAGVDLSAEDEMVVNILVDLSMRDTMNQSSFLANTVAETLPRHNIRVLENPHRFAGFAVLKAPDIPSILVEMGFMSNRNDASMLSDPSYQQQLGRALVSSIDAYFEQVRRNNRT